MTKNNITNFILVLQNTPENQVMPQMLRCRKNRNASIGTLESETLIIIIIAGKKRLRNRRLFRKINQFNQNNSIKLKEEATVWK